MKPRTLLAGTALAVAALGTPAHALCCDAVLSTEVAHGTGTVSVLGSANDVPPDYSLGFGASCDYSTSPAASSVSTQTGLLHVLGNASSDYQHGPWDITVHVHCTLVTTGGDSYGVVADTSPKATWTATAQNSERMPGGLPVKEVCVYADIAWDSDTYGHYKASTYDWKCSFPGTHFKAAQEDFTVGYPL